MSIMNRLLSRDKNSLLIAGSSCFVITKQAFRFNFQYILINISYET